MGVEAEVERVLRADRSVHHACGRELAGGTSTNPVRDGARHEHVVIDRNGVAAQAAYTVGCMI